MTIQALKINQGTKITSSSEQYLKVPLIFNLVQFHFVNYMTFLCSLPVIRVSPLRMINSYVIPVVELHHPRCVKHVGVILHKERKRLDIRAKLSMRNALLVMNVNNPLGHSSLSGERTSACVALVLILVMLR